MKAVSGKDMCCALEKRGWFLDRVRGSHHVYKHPSGGQPVTIPVHGNAQAENATSDHEGRWIDGGGPVICSTHHRHSLPFLIPKPAAAKRIRAGGRARGCQKSEAGGFRTGAEAFVKARYLENAVFDKHGDWGNHVDCGLRCIRKHVLLIPALVAIE